MQDDEEMDPEIAAAYEQFLEEMMQNETGSWAPAYVSWSIIFAVTKIEVSAVAAMIATECQNMF